MATHRAADSSSAYLMQSSLNNFRGGGLSCRHRGRTRARYRKITSLLWRCPVPRQARACQDFKSAALGRAATRTRQRLRRPLAENLEIVLRKVAQIAEATSA